MQEFASRSGAINLVEQFEREETLPLKDAVFGTLATWIKADNFEGKRRFIEEKQGLEYLSRLVCDTNVNQNFTMRLRKKIANLIADLVTNDDGIYEQNPFIVRQHFCNDSAFVNKLIEIVVNSDLSNMQELQLREYMLRILFRLHQYKPQVVGPTVTPALYSHRANILAFIAQPSADQDLKDMLNEELTLTDECLAAPTRPFVRNFESQTEEEKVREKPKGAAAAGKPTSSNIHGFSLKN